MSVSKNLVGKRFGKLMVTERTQERQNHYCVWRCRCDCGGEILVNTKRLLRGTVTDCGCMPKQNARRGSIREDLTGKKFGYLRVIAPAEKKNGRVYWKCKCICGREHVVSAHDLKAGKVKSCGCGLCRRGKGMKDLTGQKFGRLTALYATDQRDGKGSVYWHCRCDCGNMLNVTESSLIYGNYQSCGCRKREVQMEISSRLHRVDGTCVEWLEKRKYRRDNTSGFRGVSKMKNGSYRASIGFKKQRFYIGTYKCFEEAVQARLETERLIHNGFVEAYYRWKKMGGEGEFYFEVVKEDGQFRVNCNI